MIFHDATLAAIAQNGPQSLVELQGISGLGARKLEAYGEAVLRVMGASLPESNLMDTATEAAMDEF